MQLKIALAGNPNAGKTTLFNTLTGARQHVGNYPGITVDRKEGSLHFRDRSISVTDLPGTYSLTAYSVEELVARDYLVHERPDVVVNIVDASNLERNLYLTCQLLELGVPVIIALNMIDVAKSRGIEIKADILEKLLGIRVVPIIARSGFGKEELLSACIACAASQQEWLSRDISYGEDLDTAITELLSAIEKTQFMTCLYPARYTAIKYLENDDQIVEKGLSKDNATSAKLTEIVDKTTAHTQRTLDGFPEAIIANHRYGFIKSIL